MGLRNKADYNHENVFFITTTSLDWLNLLTIGNSFIILKESLNWCLNKYNINLFGFVFMPNHIHLILQTENGIDRSNFMRDFKKFTSTKVRKEIELHAPQLLTKLRHESRQQVFKVWQDRFDEFAIQTIEQMEVKLNYIHTNPPDKHREQEKWQLCKKEEDYLWSSANFYYIDYEPSNDLFIKDYRDYF